MKIFYIFYFVVFLNLVKAEKKDPVFEYLDAETGVFSMLPIGDGQQQKIFEEQIAKRVQILSNAKFEIQDDLALNDKLIKEGNYYAFLVNSMSYGSFDGKEKFAKYYLSKLGENKKTNFIKLYGVYVMLNSSQHLKWDITKLNRIKLSLGKLDVKVNKVASVKRHKNIIQDIHGSIKFLLENLDEKSIFGK